MSSVVCVKVKDIRIHGYDNLQEWMADSKNVYIGRARVVFVNGKRYPENSSIWANPYKIGADGTRDQVISKYKDYILTQIKNQPCIYNLETLRGKNLGCWCKPDNCHGDVLMELLNEEI